VGPIDALPEKRGVSWLVPSPRSISIGAFVRLNNFWLSPPAPRHTALRQNTLRLVTLHTRHCLLNPQPPGYMCTGMNAQARAFQNCL
jgi:hypothetical protein